MILHRDSLDSRISRAAKRGALLGLAVAAATSGVASAGTSPAPVSDVQASIGQGLTTYKGQPKYRAQGKVSFVAHTAGVVCQDALTLERRVKVVEHRTVRFQWIVIRAADRDTTCSPTATAQSSSLSFRNSPSPYRRLLGRSKLRLRYYLRISVNGELIVARTMVKPVTLAPLSHAFQVS